MKEIKVTINELVSLAGYSVEKDAVPSSEELDLYFDDIWADLYRDEELDNQEGKPCFIINDNVQHSIRGCYVGDELTDKIKGLILDNLDTIVFDLLFDDIVEQIDAAVGIPNSFSVMLNVSQDYTQLLRLIDKYNINISDYQYSWLLVLGENRLDLLEL